MLFGRKFYNEFKIKKKNLTLSDEIIEYILTRKTEELRILSVESIAADLGMSRFKLGKHFKKEKEIILEKYIFRIKIVRAAYLLVESDELTVKEIGEKIGYYSYGYFIHIFKKYFGTTPGRYRELAGS